MKLSKKVISEIVYRVITKINESYYEYFEIYKEKIISYIKQFGKKGKLDLYNGDLSNDYYQKYIRGAYEWMSENNPDITREGFAYFKFMFNSYIANNFKTNKRGLIYVERMIDIDMSKDLSTLDFSSVGECWSWRRGNSNNYCSASRYDILNKTPYVNVVLCGYVHPNSIDWQETIYLNSYDMKNETEIRMNDNALVEVSYIKINGEKVSLGGSYLINSSSDKYRKKEW